MVTICRVITICTLIDNSYGTGTDGYTAIDSGISIMTEDDCVFFSLL